MSKERVPDSRNYQRVPGALVFLGCGVSDFVSDVTWSLGF